jgi:hypothetical protein
MKNKAIIKYLICGAVVIVLAFLALNVPIFNVADRSAKEVTADTAASEQNRMCVLRYSYTTGAGWTVEETNAAELAGQNVYLSTVFDPRLLKDNSEFDLDYMAEYVVVIDDIGKITAEDDEIYVIEPKSITILYDTDKQNYRLKDMSCGGLIKSLLSAVNKKYRYSY